MLIKWIVCDVAESKKERFCHAQQQWAEVAGLDGFLGQVGGWDVKTPGHACLVALWDSPEQYQTFMAGAHEAIVRKNAQADTYDAIAVALFEAVWEMPGQCGSLARALALGTVLRVADCAVRDDRREHFLEVQRSVWMPGMAQAEGMLGGVFSQLRAANTRYLVATLWEDREAHARYVGECWPRLRAQAQVERDVERLDAHLVQLEPSWRVLSTSNLGR
jgi:heme-degrading monooxygenase HmoA